MKEIRFYLTKNGVPTRDKGNQAIVYCGSANVDTGTIGLNGIKLKYNHGEGTKGYFLQFPEEVGSDGKRRPIFLTTSKEARQLLTKALVKAYQAKLAELKQATQNQPTA